MINRIFSLIFVVFLLAVSFSTLAVGGDDSGIYIIKEKMIPKERFIKKLTYNKGSENGEQKTVIMLLTLQEINDDGKVSFSANLDGVAHTFSLKAGQSVEKFFFTSVSGSVLFFGGYKYVLKKHNALQVAVMTQNQINDEIDVKIKIVTTD